MLQNVQIALPAVAANQDVLLLPMAYRDPSVATRIWLGSGTVIGLSYRSPVVDGQIEVRDAVDAVGSPFAGDGPTHTIDAGAPGAPTVAYSGINNTDPSITDATPAALPTAMYPPATAVRYRTKLLQVTGGVITSQETKLEPIYCPNGIVARVRPSGVIGASSMILNFVIRPTRTGQERHSQSLYGTKVAKLP